MRKAYMDLLALALGVIIIMAFFFFIILPEAYSAEKCSKKWNFECGMVNRNVNEM